jgi:hypothetical protein
MTDYEASTWVMPVIIAITFHEAAHGFVALDGVPAAANILPRLTSLKRASKSVLR